VERPETERSIENFTPSPFPGPQDTHVGKNLQITHLVKLFGDFERSSQAVVEAGGPGYASDYD
jgi:hypothetical protein